jgi:hypothetical protein
MPKIPLPNRRTLHIDDQIELISVTEPGILAPVNLDSYSPNDGESWNECKVRARIEIQQKYGVSE